MARKTSISSAAAAATEADANVDGTAPVADAGGDIAALGRAVPTTAGRTSGALKRRGVGSSAPAAGADGSGFNDDGEAVGAEPPTSEVDAAARIAKMRLRFIPDRTIILRKKKKKKKNDIKIPFTFRPAG
jgi:hypothetical protein